MSKKDEVWILIDNLDRGWPTTGLTKEDAALIKCLISGCQKLRRELDSKNDIPCKTVIFLRNDIYELVLQHLSDRGKSTTAVIDWSDREQLKDMLKKRFAHTGQLAREMSFDSMWLRICEPYVGEQSSIDFLINRTFMRPRALIDYVNMCKAIAINKGHQRVTADDILQGTRVFSDDILQNIGFEIGDIHPDLENSVYFFIDQPSSMKIDDLVRLLKKKGVRAAQQQTLIDVFLWYGVLGIEGNDGHVHFIYDLNYNFRKLKQLIEQRRAAVRFHINPAFSYALALSAGALAPQSQLI